MIMSYERYRIKKVGQNSKQGYILLSAGTRDKLGETQRPIIVAIFDEGEIDIPAAEFQEKLKKLKKYGELQTEINKMEEENER